MNWDEVGGKWNQIKGSVKAKWGKLTDDDLTMIAGNRDRLVGKIQERYGIAKERAEEQIKDWKMPGSDVQEMPRHEEEEESRKRKAS